MSYCLGLHIDDNYIRYAKVLKEENKEPKIETYGVMFYDNLQMAIEGIIKETYSFDAEISINLNGESYYEFETFAGMDYANLKRHLKLMFAEEVCTPRDLKPSVFETRFIKTKSDTDEDATKVIYIASNKTLIAKPKQLLNNKVNKILPISLANLSLLNLQEQTNCAILDLDTYTTLTIIVKGQVKKIININLGMGNILSKLTQTYKSYSKAYSACKQIMLLNDLIAEPTKKRGRPSKNAVSDEGDLTADIESITPILYDIAERIKTQLNDYVGIINKIYLTGSAVIINDIDLYLENEIGGITVERLKPHFLANNIEASKKMKELIEVNGAIALAISPTKFDKENINFNTVNILEETKTILKDNKHISKILAKLPKKGEKKPKKPKEPKTKIAFSEQSIGVLPTALITILILSITAYIATTTALKAQYDRNVAKIDEGTANLNAIITQINADTQTININSQKYLTLQNNIRMLASQLDQINGLSNDVPSLLTRIALVMPDEVVLTKLTINDSNVSIEAECSTYAPLGFLISSLKTEEIMTNINTSLVEGASLQKIVINGVIK